MTREEFKRWRLKHRLSQAAVGRLLRVKPNTVYRWESGLRTIADHIESHIRLLPAGMIAQQRRKHS